MDHYQIGDLVKYRLGAWGRGAKHRPARVEAVHAHELLLRTGGGKLLMRRVRQLELERCEVVAVPYVPGLRGMA